MMYFLTMDSAALGLAARFFNENSANKSMELHCVHCCNHTPSNVCGIYELKG
jgi:hypothetical protein